MNINEINKLVEDYYGFLKGHTSVITNTGTPWSVIYTPFLGLFNDTIELYIKNQEDKIRISDDGVTFKNLERIGTQINRSQKRKDIVNGILINYGINLTDTNELVTDANREDFSQKKHNIISAISEINDMYMLSQHTVSSVFKEDVKAYLDEQEIIYTPQFISKGSTGLEFTFDFQIAYKDKEIVVKSFNNINKINLTHFLFSWDDIRSFREAVTQKVVSGLAIINNLEKQIKPEYLEALQNKNTEFILWDERNKPLNIKKLKSAA
jgi:hypothetical protein